MRLHPARAAGMIRAPWTPGWARDELWRRARAVPSLDLWFADSKSLVDATTGQNLVTFTRASEATFVNSQGQIQTAAIDAPRFDHNPTTGESLGLLVEEQRTNGIRNNTMVGAVAGTPGTLPTNWTQAIGSGLTREIVGIGSLGSLSYIDIRISGTTADALGWVVNFDANTQIAASSGQVWTGSLYLGIVAGSTTNMSGLLVRVIERGGEGAFVNNTNSANLLSIGSELQRIAVTRTMGATAAFAQSGIYFTANSGVAIDITLRIGMPQLEQGAFATSVIPTTTAAATRSADVASISGSNYSSWANASEGTALVNISSSVPSSGARALTLSDGTINNQAWLRLALAGTAALEVYTAGGFVAQIGSAIAQSSRTAAAIKANDFAVSVNGGTPAIDSSGAIGSYSQLNIGANFNASGSFANTTIRRLTYWPARLGNEVLQRITQ